MKKLTESFNEAAVSKGERFCIELASNPSTGYSWDIKLKQGKARLIDEAFVSDAKAPMLVGAGGKEVLTYMAEEAGTILIDAQYKRAWENNPPLQQHSFKITVK